MDAGTSIRDSTPPKDHASENTRVDSAIFTAAALPTTTVKEIIHHHFSLLLSCLILG
jgi:hypothetical protein